MKLSIGRAVNLPGRGGQGSTALPSTRCLEENGTFLQQSCKLSSSKRLSVTNANDRRRGRLRGSLFGGRPPQNNAQRAGERMRRAGVACSDAGCTSRRAAEGPWLVVVLVLSKPGLLTAGRRPCSAYVPASLSGHCAIVPTRLRGLCPSAPPCACAGGSDGRGNRQFWSLRVSRPRPVG
jgi:hypothetical protein